MMSERALSRSTQGETLARKQSVQQVIADSWIQLEQFRLLVLQTAWKIAHLPHGAARTDIAMCKVQMSRVMHDIIQRALHLHGSLGTPLETPLAHWWASVPQLATAADPTAVHQMTVAKRERRGHEPPEGPFPSEPIPTPPAPAPH